MPSTTDPFPSPSSDTSRFTDRFIRPNYTARLTELNGQLGAFASGFLLFGIALAFADVEGLAASCRFSDCSHEEEPGCAVKQAFRGPHRFLACSERPAARVHACGACTERATTVTLR